MGYSPWGHEESDMTERLHDFTKVGTVDLDLEYYLQLKSDGFVPNYLPSHTQKLSPLGFIY